uniref:Fungal lipase-type domain-containing protein n=1 Tax=Oryza glaberrima TaxID=4538 RepID=I1Q0Z5_ORYGL
MAAATPCHKGRSATAPKDHIPSLSDTIVDKVTHLLELSKGEELSIKVVGHNLGALLAVLAANELHACLATDTERDITDHHRLPLPIAVVSFNDPNIDNRVFIDHLQN